MKTLTKTFILAVVSTIGIAVGNKIAPIIIDKTSILIKTLKEKKNENN